jgi:anti-anti-sigma factor
MQNLCRSPDEFRPGGGPEIFSVVLDGSTVRLIGELDLAGVPLARAALSSVDSDGDVDGGGEVAVDCSALTFLDAAGLGVLVGARRACQAAGGDLVIVDPARCVTRLLTLTGLDPQFSIRWSQAKP